MASMNVAAMREFVLDRYPSINWKRRVSEMRDDQIIAVYHSLLGRKKKEQPKEEYRQMTIFDYISKED